VDDFGPVSAMTQLTLFAFPDEPRSFSPSPLTQTDKWDNWCLAMMCGPRSFWDDDEQEYGPLAAHPSAPRQETFVGLI
jgi:hypothetical protein